MMPLSDRNRIANDRDTPRIVALWQALTALRSVVSFMNTGAHPDDEHSAMLAALRFRDGIDISYACSTRGEGGQNDIGVEATEALGVLRTAEMEAACRRLDMAMYWHSVSPDDTIFDFGFSKSGIETLGKWGRVRTLARFVDILRRAKPDIICPTFLDIPGQHGHHRAMTQAAHDVMDMAADPGFAENDLPAWQVKKLYLPAWSGAGRAYDDDLPPPPATLTVSGTDGDPVTGWSFARMGQQSRVMHATQAMGRWVPPGGGVEYPLHLVRSHVAGPDVELASGLAATLQDLDAPGGQDLGAAQDHMDAAISAFPDFDLVLEQACLALDALRRGMVGCPNAILHKLERKEQQLARVVRLAAGVQVLGRFAADELRPGDRVAMETELTRGAAQVSVGVRLPAEWSLEANQVTLSESAEISDPYPDTYLPGLPDAPCLSLAMEVNGVSAEDYLPFEVTPIVIPACSATLSPAGDIINVNTGGSVTIDVMDIAPLGAVPAVTLPVGWTAETGGSGFVVTPPQGVKPGLYDIALTLNGKPAQSVQRIAYPHIEPRVLTRPAVVQVRVVDLAVPAARIGYIGGGNDRVGHWLDRMGATVVDLSEEHLTAQVLEGFDTLVVGIFAMKFREGLAQAMPIVHDWARAGGTLVTLYHRPWDDWDPDTIPPHRLEIGQPSLRWRVTDETADVTVLAEDHPVLNVPNRIEASDWAGWHKERGLYFAKSWDAAYTPLVSMHDPDEQALEGAWLVADVGKGRHIHTSLILHHQMEKLTPGAFRIMANLIARRG